MKATGIVRRIDDLGRVVVPKEIRRTLRIREGEPLEIFTNREGGIVLKKYSPIGELAAFAKEYVEAVAQGAKCTVCVTGPGKKDYAGKSIHRELLEAIEDRRTILATDAEPDFSQVTEDETEVFSEAAATILAEGDAIGMVLLLSRDTERIFGEFEQKMAICGANFLGRQMEP